MKESLSPENRKDIVQYRLDRAVDTLAEAKYTAEGQMYNLAINRLYYACFYAASALLIHDGIEASTHSGVKTHFSKNYILTQKFPTEFGTVLSILFNLRHTADYEDFINCDANTIKMYLPLVESFVSSIKHYVEEIDIINDNNEQL